MTINLYMYIHGDHKCEGLTLTFVYFRLFTLKYIPHQMTSTCSGICIRTGALCRRVLDYLQEYFGIWKNTEIFLQIFT